MNEIGYALMTVPGREKQREDLERKLTSLGIKALIVVDVLHKGHYHNALWAWQQLHEQYIQGVVLEDDVVLCDNFRDIAERAIHARPAEIISFFNISKGVRKAYDQKYSWGHATSNAWNQCIYMPTLKAITISGWARNHVRSRWWDVAVSLYCLTHEEKIYYSIPCLVEHIQIASSAGNAKNLFGRPRIAGMFLDLPPPDFQDLRSFNLGGQRLKHYPSEFLG